MIRTINTNTNPQPSFGVQNSTVPIFTPQGRTGNVLKPVQVVGLVPLVCKTQDTRIPPFSKCDCREWTNDDCYINPVFATSTHETDPLKNDHNMFLLEYPFYYAYQWSSGNNLFTLHKWDGSIWALTTPLINNLYGTYYNFNSLCKKNWTGFDIDWQKVLLAFGEGMYHIEAQYSIFGSGDILVSEPFCLKEWSCEGTDVTVRWESTITGGRIGSITTDCNVFDFCCNEIYDLGVISTGVVTWRDQLRVYAFFGREKTEYEKVQIEYQDGTIVQTKNESIQKFEYESALQPKWVHDRLKAYAFMADELYVTDYNWNNSDYEIQKKLVVCDGSYEPEYHEDTRYSYVKVQFKEGCQNVIRDKCCDIPTRPPSQT